MDIFGNWLAGFKSENTRRAYRKEIEAFGLFCGHENVRTFVAMLFDSEPSEALWAAESWRADKAARGLSTATSNRSMAAINSLFAYARRSAATNIRLDLKSEFVKREVREGIGADAVNALMAAADMGKRHETARDRVIIFLIITCGLTRSEVSSLNVSDIDLVDEVIRIGTDVYDLPAEIMPDLKEWLRLKRASFGKGEFLFTSIGRNSGQRMTEQGVATVFRKLSNRAGIKANVSGLRAEAIAEYVRKCDGNLNNVLAFARRRQVAA